MAKNIQIGFTFAAPTTPICRALRQKGRAAIDKVERAIKAREVEAKEEKARAEALAVLEAARAATRKTPRWFHTVDSYGLVRYTVFCEEGGAYQSSFAPEGAVNIGFGARDHHDWYGVSLENVLQGGTNRGVWNEREAEFKAFLTIFQGKTRAELGLH